MTDRELLEQLAKEHTEDAFNEIVRRHVDLVHSAAIRQLGSSDTARDITQNVFILLAKQAKQIGPDAILTGWLYRTTRNLCLEHIRKDQRRREREQAAADQLMNSSIDQWEHVAPELEPAMDDLTESDRHAVLLRFFKNKSLRDVGKELGIGEDAAQKRVSRALDRLRDIFSKRGVTLSATALASSISGSAVQAAPAAILSTISSAAVGATAVAATAATLNTASTMTTLFNLKTTTAVIAAAAVTGTSTYLVKENQVDELRTEQSELAADHAQLLSDQQSAMALIQTRDNQVAALKKDIADLPRLRGEVDRLNRELEQMAALKDENRQLKSGFNTVAEKLANLEGNKTDERNNLPADTDAVELAAREKQMNDMRHLGLAQIMFADDNNGWFPQTLEEAKPYLKNGPSNVELTYTGKVQDLTLPAMTIVARETTFHQTSDGRYYRFYTFADGHSEIKAGDSLQEIADWEQIRIIPADRQARRTE